MRANRHYPPRYGLPQNQPGNKKNFSEQQAGNKKAAAACGHCG
jgi:hypothetical protein